VSNSTPQAAVAYAYDTAAAAAANSSSSTLSLNTATATASCDSTLTSGGIDPLIRISLTYSLSARANHLRSTSPCNNLNAPGITRSASNKSVEGLFISTNFNNQSIPVELAHANSAPEKKGDANVPEQSSGSGGGASSKATSAGGSTSLNSQSSPSLLASQIIPTGSVFACGTSCSQIICTPLRTMVSQNR
jgi:hypothetical protein